MNILVVVHNYVGLGKRFGGVELTVHEMMEAAAKDTANPNKFYVLSCDARRMTSGSRYVLLDLSRQTENGIAGLEQEAFEIPDPVSLESYHNEQFATEFQGIIQRYGIDIVHFHHLMYFPLNAPIIAQQAGALTVLSLHDYHALCPEGHLLYKGKTFCGFPEDTTLDTCNACLREVFGYGHETQKFRRQLIAEILEVTDAIQYQSQDERNRFCAAYSFLSKKETLVIGSPLVLTMPKVGSGLQPLPVLQSKNSPKRSNGLPSLVPGVSRPIPVICLGNLSQEKGGDAFVELFQRLAKAPGPKKFQFHLYGDIRSPYDKKIQALSKSGVVVVHGKYDNRLLMEELKGCKGIALFGSNWPETWVRTLSESTACGLVPVAPRIGAFIERISDGSNGLLYEPASVDSMLGALESIADEPGKLQRMQEEVSSIACPTIEDNVAAFDTLYSKLWNASTEPEYARRRADKIARLLSSSRPLTWAIEFTPGADMTMPILALTGTETAAKRKPLLLRTWGVFRRRGLGYTLWATVNYKKLRRTH